MQKLPPFFFNWHLASACFLTWAYDYREVRTTHTDHVNYHVVISLFSLRLHLVFSTNGVAHFLDFGAKKILISRDSKLVRFFTLLLRSQKLHLPKSHKDGVYN